MSPMGPNMGPFFIWRRLAQGEGETGTVERLAWAMTSYKFYLVYLETYPVFFKNRHSFTA